MKRDSSDLSISKIYIFLLIVGMVGTFLLLIYPRLNLRVVNSPDNSDLINQALLESVPLIKSIWLNPANHVDAVKCALPKNVGMSYLECNPEGWQCVWDNIDQVKLVLGGNTYHIKAAGKLEFVKRQVQGINESTGYIGEIEIVELNKKQKIFLSRTCHEVYLPERTYAYGEVKDLRDPGFLWDNAGRKLFIDKFYVSEREVVEWRNYLGQNMETKTPWKPAKLKNNEQEEFCQFHGKNVLMAHFFDATQMTPLDQKIKFPDMVIRPDTPWQRDYHRTFLNESRNPEYQLNPRDCSLAEVKGCPESYFMTDSVSWSGVAFGLGFEEERFFNPIDPDLELKKSSHFEVASSPWHKLGRRGKASDEASYSFRCFREIL